MRRNPEIKGISSGLLGAHSLIHDEPRFSQWKQALSSMLRCEKTLVFVRVFIVSERSKVIVSSIDPESWSSRGGNSLEVIDDTELEIYATEEQHRQIKELLTALRQMKKVGVSVNIRLLEADRVFFEKEVSRKLDKINRINGAFFPMPIDASLGEFIKRRSTTVESLRKNIANGGQVTLLSRRRAFTYLELTDKGNKPELSLNVGFEGEVLEAITFVTGDRRMVQMRLSEHVTQLLRIQKKTVVDPHTEKEVKIDSPTLLKRTMSTAIQISDGGVVLLPLHYYPRDVKAKDHIWLIMLEPKITVAGEKK